MKRKCEIQVSLEKNLSGLQMTARHQAAIREKIREGEKMKKKIPMVLAMALVLALVSVTAVAMSNWNKIKDYLKTVRFLSYEAFYEWTLDEKMQLVEAMHQAGFEMDEAAYASLLEEGKTESEKEKICDAIIESRYGEEWQFVDIEAFEWPVEVRRESEENMREYDMWSDSVQEEWQDSHPSIELTQEKITEEFLRERFLGMMTEVWGFTLESIDQEKIELVMLEELCQASYMITKENPGQYCLSMMEKAAGMQERTMMQHMAEKQGMQESYTFLYRTDPFGNELLYTTEPMEQRMIGHMENYLTEASGFLYGSYDPSLFEIHYLKDQGLWRASYTITEENPGEFEMTVDEIRQGEEPITVLEFMRRQEGKKDSFTFTCYYDEFDRYVPRERAENEGGKEIQAQVRYEPALSPEKAIEEALKVLDEKYPITMAELKELDAHPALYAEQDGSHEFYIEFVGYEYSEQLARVWSYAARVDADTGKVLAAIRRDEWNGLTGRKLTEDASPEMKLLIWEHNMQNALREAAGDMEGNGWPLHYNEEGQYFYEWSLEEKAAHSRLMKPLIDAFLQQNPEYASLLEKRYREEMQDGPPYYNTTRHVYGLPDEKSISREKALEIARQAVLEKMKVKPEQLDGAWTVNCYYDVTDYEKPLWKFYFNTTNLAVYPDDPWGYMVYLDAYTGEIAQCFIRTVKTSMIDLM